MVFHFPCTARAVIGGEPTAELVTGGADVIVGEANVVVEEAEVTEEEVEV